MISGMKKALPTRDKTYPLRSQGILHGEAEPSRPKSSLCGILPVSLYRVLKIRFKLSLCGRSRHPCFRIMRIITDCAQNCKPLFSNRGFRQSA